MPGGAVKNLEREMRASVDGGGLDRVASGGIYQSIREEEWRDMHVLLKDISKKIGVEEKLLRMRKTLREDFFPPRKSRCKLSTGDLRCKEVSLSIWRVLTSGRPCE